MSMREVFADRPALGRLTESAVGAHLLNAAAGGECELFYWRHHNHEVDFVLRKGKKLVAIEVKSGKAPGVFPGMEAFAKKFKPTRALLVGKGGVSVETFLSAPVARWFR